MTQDEALSALLDDALPPEDAARLRAAIAADPALRADHAALARVDEALETFAREMAFLPQVALPATRATRPRLLSAGALALGLCGLLAIRMLPKLLDMPLAGLAVQALAAGAILVAILALTREHGGTQEGARA